MCKITAMRCELIPKITFIYLYNINSLWNICTFVKQQRATIYYSSFIIHYSIFIMVTKFPYHSLIPCFDWIVVRFVMKSYNTCMEWRLLPFMTIYISVPIIECVKFTFSSLLFESLQNSILLGEYISMMYIPAVKKPLDIMIHE